MKKLIIVVLMLVPILGISQLKEIPLDKKQHNAAGIVIGGGSFWGAQAAWGDEDTSLRFSIACDLTIPAVKEFGDCLNGKRFSWSDFKHGFVPAIVITGVSYGVVKLVKHIKGRRTTEVKDPFDISNDELVRVK